MTVWSRKGLASFTLQSPGIGPRPIELPLQVELEGTPSNFGKVRWAMICPDHRNGDMCGRRVKKLYLPPGSNKLGCRVCHQLTYRSCQQNHSYGSVAAFLSKAIPHLSEEDCRRLLSNRPL